ncbi:hypothetical protein ID866_12647 [Astraeus odoratus]|nr:hypothetical protein ID866_12647 [Astraeus odoratus]
MVTRSVCIPNFWLLSTTPSALSDPNQYHVCFHLPLPSRLIKKGGGVELPTALASDVAAGLPPPTRQRV